MSCCLRQRLLLVLLLFIYFLDITFLLICIDIYIWKLNNRSLYDDDSFHINANDGERYKFVITSIDDHFFFLCPWCVYDYHLNKIGQFLDSITKSNESKTNIIIRCSYVNEENYNFV